LLRWLYPELMAVIDSLRKCYWSEDTKNERDDAFGPFI
ncbi:hypothetical protein LCGC14_1993820, partial [marine sediment metagenome]